MMNVEGEELVRLRAFQEARSQKNNVDPAAVLAWRRAAFERKHESANKSGLADLYKQALGDDGQSKGGGLLLDSGHTWLGRTALDIPSVMTAFHVASGVVAGSHQFASLLANPLLAAAGRSLTNVLVGMQVDTPQFARNIKSAETLSAIWEDMLFSRERLEQNNEELQHLKEYLIFSHEDQDFKNRVEALRSYLSPNSENPQNSPLMQTILKADRDQKKYPERMAVSKLNWQSRRHIIALSIVDGITSAAAFAKGGLLGSVIAKCVLNPLYIVAGHYDFKTKIEKTHAYNAKYADMVKDESKYKPEEDLTEDDMDLSRTPQDRNRANTRAAFIEIMACEDLGDSFLKLSKLERKLLAETKEEDRLLLQSKINDLKVSRDIYKNDLKIFQSKRDYDSLSVDGKIRKCILSDTFYVKEATIALLCSPGVLAGDFFQRLTTTGGALIPGIGHELGTTHDIPSVAHALRPDGSAVMTTFEETNTGLSTATQRDHKGTAFKPPAIQIRKAAQPPSLGDVALMKSPFDTSINPLRRPLEENSHAQEEPRKRMYGDAPLLHNSTWENQWFPGSRGLEIRNQTSLNARKNLITQGSNYVTRPMKPTQTYLSPRALPVSMKVRIPSRRPYHGRVRRIVSIKPGFPASRGDAALPKPTQAYLSPRALPVSMKVRIPSRPPYHGRVRRIVSIKPGFPASRGDAALPKPTQAYLSPRVLPVSMKVRIPSRRPYHGRVRRIVSIKPGFPVSRVLKNAAVEVAGSAFDATPLMKDATFRTRTYPKNLDVDLSALENQGAEAGNLGLGIASNGLGSGLFQHPVRLLGNNPKEYDSFHSLNPWPEEVSAKSSAAYKSCYTFRERLMHNLKGLGKFAIAAPVFLYHRHKARKERVLLRQTMIDTNQLLGWFAGRASSERNDTIATVVDEMKIFLKELHVGLHSVNTTLKHSPSCGEVLRSPPAYDLAASYYHLPVPNRGNSRGR